jgi:hypothetical protein
MNMMSKEFFGGDFLSFYSQFYEVITLESTYAMVKEKNEKCISRC